MVGGALLIAGLAGCDGSQTNTAPAGTATDAGSLPHFDHIVVVVEENQNYDRLVGAQDAPEINSLMQRGAVFTNYRVLAHPSQPNYLALFAGSTFGLISDACPQRLTGPNLASELIARGKTFTGYSEDLPQPGFTGCFANGDAYARKHNPWVNFDNVPASANQPFSAFPSDYTQLPTVAFVVPSQYHDMHSGPVSDGDAWLCDHIEPYAQWAVSHRSLLILTWDEDEGTTGHILTLAVGASVKAGRYGEPLKHTDLLRTIGLNLTHDAAQATTIKDIWLS
jgi:phosphatidylinositol-3-phosphatase